MIHIFKFIITSSIVLLSLPTSAMAQYDLAGNARTAMPTVLPGYIDRVTVCGHSVLTERGFESRTINWIVNSAQSSDVSTANSPLETQVNPIVTGHYTSEQVLRFEVSENVDVRIEAITIERRRSSNKANPMITLRDAKGNVLLADDNSGGDQNAAAMINLNPGEYCLFVNNYGFFDLESKVRVGRSEHPRLTDTNLSDGPDGATEKYCQNAGRIEGFDQPATSSMLETPYWSFEIDTPTVVDISTQSAGANIYAALYDSSYDKIAETPLVFQPSSARTLSELPLQKGKYCLGIVLDDPNQPLTVTISQ